MFPIGTRVKVAENGYFMIGRSYVGRHGVVTCHDSDPALNASPTDPVHVVTLDGEKHAGCFHAENLRRIMGG